ncbi:hypothetical protein KW846_28840 [Pseudomonas sp. PDM32]|uniref:hypothetical protein n=1 Tax=Pseudomonas sp. PDM32 TaxID=2854768 RepID=UPI001C44CCC1|nr:hypothetical protein [Pseudomonas sp. PDM32]MBV7576730.1 hypothetical protein [Pseudomonas sp. PDM32]
MIKSLMAALAFAPVVLLAAERNDVPSCYEITKLTEFKSPSSGRLLTVIVDQTTPLTGDLQQTAWNHIKRFMGPGDKLRLYSFSAYLNGRYTKLEFAGELESPIDPAAIPNVPIMAAKKFDGCLTQQRQVLFQRFGKAFAGTIKASTTDIPRSEILFSLREIANDISKAKDTNDQVVLLMSDMLEYSDFGSFYASNRIRDISAPAELEKVKKQNLLADFGGARIYVHGAAFVPQSNKDGYRSGKMISNLKIFWNGYFEQSNAELRGFGTPELTSAVE